MGQKKKVEVVEEKGPDHIAAVYSKLKPIGQVFLECDGYDRAPGRIVVEIDFEQIVKHIEKRLTDKRVYLKSRPEHVIVA